MSNFLKYHGIREREFCQGDAAFNLLRSEVVLSLNIVALGFKSPFGSVADSISQSRHKRSLRRDVAACGIHIFQAGLKFICMASLQIRSSAYWSRIVGKDFVHATSFMHPSRVCQLIRMISGLNFNFNHRSAVVSHQKLFYICYCFLCQSTGLGTLLPQIWYQNSILSARISNIFMR